MPQAFSFLSESRQLLKLALPLIGAQLAAIGMGTLDTVMAGHYSQRALAAVALGTNLGVPALVFCLGLTMAVSPIVAHHRGAAGDPAEIGALLRRALVSAGIVALVWWAALQFASAWLIAWIGLDADTERATVSYLRALSWSAFGFATWFVLRYGAEGSARPAAVFLSGVLALLLNGLLDWLLIFGKGPFPELGGTGCGWATSTASLAASLMMLAAYRADKSLRSIRLFSRGARSPESVAGVWRLGAPIGLILAFEAGLFSVVGLLAGRLGDSVVAAYQIALNFAAMLFMIPMGVGLATTVRVGQALGAGDRALARARGLLGMKLGVLNAGSNSLIMGLGASLAVALYTRDAAVAPLARHFLVLAACFQFFDGLQATAAGALRGLKDTRVPLAISMMAYWIVGMPTVWWLAFHTPLGADGLWWGLTASLFLAAAGLSARFIVKMPALQAYRTEGSDHST